MAAVLETIRGLEDEATIMRVDPGAVTGEADTTTEVSYIYFSNELGLVSVSSPVL